MPMLNNKRLEVVRRRKVGEKVAEWLEDEAQYIVYSKVMF